MAASKQGAAEREVQPETKTITFEGIEIVLPAKLPFRALLPLRDDDLVGLREAIVPKGKMAEIWALDIDIDRGREFMTEVLEHYGISLGEAEASSES